jgi:hypothetical protein
LYSGEGTLFSALLLALWFLLRNPFCNALGRKGEISLPRTKWSRTYRLWPIMDKEGNTRRKFIMEHDGMRTRGKGMRTDDFVIVE